MSGNTGAGSASPLVIAGIYVGLMIILMVFFVVLTSLYGNSAYKPDWIPDASKTVMDLIKVVVGAIIGVFTPSAVAAAKRR